MNYKLYEVGGKIRDHYLGLKSKDTDYAVVIEPPYSILSLDEIFISFKKDLEEKGFKIFQESPATLTVRAMFPSGHPLIGVADFVIARREQYIEDSRTPKTFLGTLKDDLLRRDFTVNAMAKDIEGQIIDPFNGRGDLLAGILRTPTDAAISFNNDPLRILRALRFNITKDLSLSHEIVDAIKLFRTYRMNVVSKERIIDELEKMFKHDTKATLNQLQWLQNVNYELHSKILEGFWLLPTTKKQ